MLETLVTGEASDATSERGKADSHHQPKVQILFGPYHRLIKDYKLVHDAINDPVRDCELALRVAYESLQQLGEQPEDWKGLLAGDCNSRRIDVRAVDIASNTEDDLRLLLEEALS